MPLEQVSNPAATHPALSRRFSVAPMMDWTDRHCRFFHRLMTRRAMLYTEMVTSAALVHGPKARLLVVTPTHQFPTGVRMSLKRRLSLLDWARSHDGWVVEDDYDGEFQYGAHRIPALTSLQGADRVL